MPLKIAAITFACAVLVSGSAGAQAKPDFSGRWVQVSPSSPAEGGGNEQSVRQSDSAVTTDHASGGGGHSQVYKFDAESRGTLGHGIDVISKAAWDGPKLVLTSTATYPDNTRRQSRQQWTLGPDGTLTIESSMKHPDGTVTERKSVHRKK